MTRRPGASGTRPPVCVGICRQSSRNGVRMTAISYPHRRTTGEESWLQSHTGYRRHVMRTKEVCGIERDAAARGCSIV